MANPIDTWPKLPIGFCLGKTLPLVCKCRKNISEMVKSVTCSKTWHTHACHVILPHAKLCILNCYDTREHLGLLDKNRFLVIRLSVRQKWGTLFNWIQSDFLKKSEHTTLHED